MNAIHIKGCFVNNIFLALLLTSSLSLGFNQPIPFVISVSALIVICLIKRSKVYVTYELIGILMVSFFYVFVYLFGNSNFISNSEYSKKIFLYFSFFLLYLIIVSNLSKKTILNKVYPVVVYGVFLRVLCTVLYSISTSPIYGYGLVLDPIRGYETNSPEYSNLLVLPICYFIHQSLSTHHCKRLFYLVSLGLAIFSAFYLGGRFVFIVSIIFVLLSFNNYNIKTKTLLIVFLTLGVGVFIYYNIGSEYVELVKQRFIEGGSSHKRLHHLSTGFESFLNHPLGGFRVDTDMEKTKWFHNILLDSAKVLGLISTLPLIYIIIKLTLIRNASYKCQSIYLCSVVLLLTMCQDVVLEGNYILLFIYLLMGTYPFYAKQKNSFINRV